MGKMKRALAVITALCAIIAASGCDDGSDSSVSTIPMNESEKSVIDDVINSHPDLGTIEELENKTVKWFCFWDINPGEGQKISPALELFHSAYDGEIKYIQTTWDKQYDDLASLIVAGDHPDFITACDMELFPRAAIREQIAPFDDYIDLNSELWSDTKEAMDGYTLNDEHYICISEVTGSEVCIYNKSVIDENGLDQPADLLAQGKWDWNTFRDMMSEFCSTDEGIYGMDSWYYERALSLTSGVPIISVEDGVIVNNLNDKNLERVQNFMYDLANIGVVLPKAEFGWGDFPARVGTGETLFYIAPTWALSNLENYGGSENAMFVPMPKDPESDKYYLAADMNAYAFVKDGPNPEGVAAYLKCLKVSAKTDEVRQLSIDSLKEQGWTDEMIEMNDKVNEITLENPVFEYYSGMSSDLSGVIDSAIRESIKSSVQWATTRESIYQTVQLEVDEFNAAIK